ncbi:MAG TPA: excinuclease ABC subunit UvrC [Candidatus Thermoplasmatota archaeon]|nr:excinuclease ABC subunit UvrC [Candidatus Thermoplasmatota archaeon]
MSEALREQVALLPRAPGVYQWKDAGGTVLYVGKAVDLRARAGSYLDPATAKTGRLMQEAAALDYIAVRTEKEALLLEQTLIKRLRPRFNVRLTDDKQYPYLKLTSEPYPRLLKVHRREDDGATYFGPFPDGSGAFHILQALNDLVPLRRCRVLPKEKCLYYDIGKCVAPCIGACTDAEYQRLVDEVRALLRGRSDRLVGEVQARLEKAAAEHRFEQAALLRDQLHSLQNILDRQHMVQERLEERDVAVLAASGDLGVVVLLHQRDGQIAGQSVFHVAGVAPGEEPQGLVEFLRGYYQDRLVPRHVTADLPEALGPPLERELRLLREGAVTVEAPQRGDKRRWVEVALTNARLRLEEERHRRQRRGTGALEALQQALALAAPPRSIEGFDVTHLAGEFTRASLVRFADGEPDKSAYRTFNMRSVGTRRDGSGAAVGAGGGALRGAGREVDDFASLAEAVARRYRGLQERGEALPDLIVIDGGPGQLAAAREALRALGLQHVPLCSLAKEEELVFVPSRLQPLRLRRDDPALQLLQRVRDEAHRFGIKHTHAKATQAVTASPLDGVPGIGPKRRAELVKAFGGLEGLRAASVEDLQRVPGITPAMAQKVVAVLDRTAEVEPAP